MTPKDATTPAWAHEDFETLLENCFADVFAAHFVGRPVDEVMIVRQGIHAFHRGDKTSMLSSMMLQRLRKGGFTCPLCGGKF